MLIVGSGLSEKLWPWASEREMVLADDADGEGHRAHTGDTGRTAGTAVTKETQHE